MSNDTQRSVKLRIVADAGTAKQTLDDIAAKADDIDGKRSSVRVNIQSGTTKEQLDDIIAKADALGIKNVTFNVKANTASANANIDETDRKLDEVGGRDATAKVDVDTGDATEKLTAIDAGLDDVGSKHVTARVSVDGAEAEAEIAALDAQLSSLSGRTIMLTAAVGGLGMALPALPGALAAVGAAAGVGALAFGGLGKAMSDAAAQSSATGKSSSQLAATELANSIAIVNAERAISDAKTQAAHDAVTSAQSVMAAQEQLKNAEQSEQQAEQSLTEARQQAVLTLQQLNDAQADAALGAQQAQLNLEQAQANQQQVNANAGSTALQKAQADLSVKEAQQALTEAQQNATNSTNAANKANKEGVNGLPAVVSAQQAVAKAAQATADAQTNLAKAQQQATWTQQKDAEAIKVAEQNLVNTYKQQAAAARAASSAGSSAANRFAKDMAAMTPEGRKVVGQLLNMKSAVKGLQRVAQVGLLPGVSVFLTGLKSLIPGITGEVGSMSQILGGGFTSAGKAMRSSGVQKELQAVFKEGNQLASVLLPALGGVVSAFLKLGSQSGSALAGLGSGLASILKGVGDLVTGLGPGAAAFGEIFSSIGVAVGSLGKPLAALIVAFAQGLAPTLVNLAPVIVRLANGLTDIIKALPPPLVAGLVIGLMNVGRAMKIWEIIQGVLNAELLANPITLVVIAVAALVTAIVLIATKTRWFQDMWDSAWGFIKSTFDKVFGWIKHNWPLIAGILLGPIALVAGEIIQHWDAIVKGASSMIGSITSFMTGLPGKIVNALASLADDMYNIGVNVIWGVIKGVEAEVGQLFHYLGQIASDIGSVFSSVLHIASPSRLFMRFGQFTMQGFINGVRLMRGEVTGVMAETAAAVSSAWRVQLPSSTAAGGIAGGYGGQHYSPVFNVTVQGLVGDAGATGRQIVVAANEYLRQTGQRQLVGT